MTRLFSSALFVLMPWLALAAGAETPPQPVEVSAWGMIVFGVVFLTMVLGFLGFIWWKERSRKQQEKKS